MFGANILRVIPICGMVSILPMVDLLGNTAVDWFCILSYFRLDTLVNVSGPFERQANDGIIKYGEKAMEGDEGSSESSSFSIHEDPTILRINSSCSPTLTMTSSWCGCRQGPMGCSLYALSNCFGGTERIPATN